MKSRSVDLEKMDDLDCQGEVVDQTLRELEIINRLLGGDDVTLKGVAQLIGKNRRPFLTIADLGCGGGDLAMKMVKWGKQNSVLVKLTGVDANPHIVEYAKVNTRQFPEIEFLTANVFSSDFQRRTFDILTATLFIHHFTEEELVRLFSAWKTQATMGIVINDIHRHFLSFHSIRLLTRFFSRSEMVQYDAPLSVRRAFKKKELELILHRAGITNFSLSWKWAFRWQLVIRC